MKSFQEMFDEDVARRKVVAIIAENAKDVLAQEEAETDLVVAAEEVCNQQSTPSPSEQRRKPGSRLSALISRAGKKKPKGKAAKAASKQAGSKKSAGR